MKNLFFLILVLNSAIGFSETLECKITVAVKDTDFDFTVSEELEKKSPEQVYLSASKQINLEKSQFNITVFAQTTKVGRYLVGAEVEDKKSGVVSKVYGDTKNVELSVANAKSPNITQHVAIECDVKL